MRRVLIILGLMALMPGAARADITVPLAHAKLHLPIPDGYCPLDTERAREATAFDNQQKSYQGQIRLLAMAVDCAELEGFRVRDRPFEHYVTIEAAIKDSQLVRRPDSERAAFLDETLQEVGKIGAKEATAENNHWLNNFNVSADVKEFALAAHDEDAVYLRVVGVLGVRARDPIPVAKIYAMTLTAGYQVSIAVYAHGDAHALPGMLELAKHEIARLIAANPPLPVLPAPPPIPQDQADTAASTPTSQPDTIFGQSGGTIVTAALAVMLVSFLLLLMFRPVRRR
jgi:hypothetical protein